MARKKKNTDIVEFEIDHVLQPVQDLDVTEDFLPIPLPGVDNAPLLNAVANLIKLYSSTHTIEDYDSFKYPGLKEVVIAYDQITAKKMGV